MADRDAITQELVREYFDYIDGKLYWKIKRFKVRTGTEAGCSTRRRGKDWYRVVRLDGSLYLVHRIIFLWHHGWMPEQIDHINRDVLDNRIENLRPTTSAQNRWNSDAVERARGVQPRNGKWVASIYVENRRRNLGRFDTESEARAAYLSARREIRGC